MTKINGKMILTFNSEVYSQLLSEYQLRIIKTEEENDNFLAVVEELLDRPQLSPEQNALLELLIRLIEDFEDKHYQINASSPQSRLLHLMEARNLTEADLVPVLDSQEIVQQFMSGKIELTHEQAEALGKFFHVDASLFI
jgi:HTH-type transcriptional regulator / antitoxin HigA